MISFILFSLQNVANIVIIGLVPNSIAVEFLQGYSAGNILFSFIGTIVFGSIQNNKIYKYLFFIAAMSLLGVQYWGLKIYYVAFFYPCLIVFADLSASQMLDEKRLVKVRFVLILTGFLFLLPNYFREMLDLRYYILMLIILYCIFFGMVPKNLKIKSSILYLICVYTSYSIVLYLMAKIISSPEELKVWYLFSQISLVMLLKLIDFESRIGAKLDSRINHLIKWLSLLVLFSAFVVYPNLQALLLASAGWTGLMLTKRYMLK